MGTVQADSCLSFEQVPFLLVWGVRKEGLGGPTFTFNCVLHKGFLTGSCCDRLSICIHSLSMPEGICTDMTRQTSKESLYIVPLHKCKGGRRGKEKTGKEKIRWQC